MKRLFPGIPRNKYKDFSAEELALVITRKDINVTKEEGFDAEKFEAFELFSSEPHTLKEYLENKNSFFIFIRTGETDLPFGIIFGSIIKLDPEGAFKLLERLLPDLYQRA
jgi:hypothetical protein